MLGFDGGDKPGPTQAGHIGRVPVCAGLHERVHGSIGGVVAQDGGQGVHEHRFAVGTRAIQKEQRVLACRSSQGIPCHPGKIGLQRLITARDLMDELPPGGAITRGGGRRDLGQSVQTVVGAQHAILEIHHAAWRVEQPGVGIPLVGGGGMTPIGACEPLQASHRATAGEFGCHPVRIGLECSLPTDLAHQVVRGQGLLGLPALAGPEHPLAPQSDIAPVLGVPTREGQRQRVFCGPHRLLGRICRLCGVCCRRLELDALTIGKEGLHIKALRNGISRVPAIGRPLRILRRGIGRRHQHRAMLGTGCHDRFGGIHGVFPAGFVAVRPNQDMLALERRPVGLVDGRVGTMHRSGRAMASVDQGLGAFFAFDQNYLIGMGNARLVEQRPRIGRRHFATLGIPRAEFLTSRTGLIAIHAGNQTAVSGQIVPLGGGWTQFIYRRACLASGG